MQLADVVVGQLRPPDRQAQLVERQVLAHADRERQGHDLEVQRALVAGGDLVEAEALVGDHAGEHVDPPGRALRVGLAAHVGGQRQPFLQRDQVRTVRLEDHAFLAQVELVEDVVLGLAFDGLGVGQEAAADAIRDLAET